MTGDNLYSLPIIIIGTRYLSADSHHNLFSLSEF
jgi:hypothetical protein